MDTHSTASGGADSSKPAPSRKTFALLESDSDLQRFVDAWKAGRLPKAQWTHAAHVARDRRARREWVAPDREPAKK